MPRPQLGELEIAVGHLRFGVIAIAVVVIAGFAALGAQNGVPSDAGRPCKGDERGRTRGRRDGRKNLWIAPYYR
jgi:hypothetical protein